MKKFSRVSLLFLLSFFIFSLCFLGPAEATQKDDTPLMKGLVSKVSWKLTSTFWKANNKETVENRYNNPDLSSPPQISLSHSLKAFFSLSTPSVKEFVEKEKFDYYRALFGLNIAF